MIHPVPEIHCWYQNTEDLSWFEVVAVDDHAKTVEIQDQEGAIYEYDLSSWHLLPLTPVAAPEDWQNCFELCKEDMEDQDHTIVPENWSGSLNDIEPASLLDLEDF